MEIQQNELFAGRYRLENELGSGGFGEVWKAFDNVTEQFVAIKIHHRGDTEHAAREIVKEFTRMMNIHHANLLTPMHVDIADGKIPYLVMELCEHDLSDMDLPEKDVWQLIRDVASGLKCLADNKKRRHRPDGTEIEVPDPIIHQDIKPANILLRSNGMYAISDFGISKRRLSTLSTNDQNGQTQQMDSAMTVDYAAPERFPRGVGKAVLASDIWSLGAMLFEIVEGKRPFDDGGGNCQNQGIPIPPITREGYSDELKSIIYACMAKNPADRPTAAQLKEYAGKVLKEEPRVKIWHKRDPDIIEKAPIKKENAPISSDGKYGEWRTVILIAGPVILLLIAIGVIFSNTECSRNDEHGEKDTKVYVEDSISDEELALHEAEIAVPVEEEKMSDGERSSMMEAAALAAEEIIACSNSDPSKIEACKKSVIYNAYRAYEYEDVFLKALDKEIKKKSISTARSGVYMDGNTLRFTVDGQEYSYKMVYVSGGTYTMGCTSEQGNDCFVNEKPAHSVTVGSFYIGQTEVTQALWKAVMGSNPCRCTGNNLPVERVTYNDVKEFFRKLNSMTGATFRLPTEEEWEYAARGGNSSRGYKYSGSDNIGSVAWYDGNSDKKPHPVAQKNPNELGLYDMSGNVWEWCSSIWCSNYNSARSGSDRVVRGGGWYFSAEDCRVSNRLSFGPSDPDSNLGFRLAR